jgi:hypothetical protein
MKRSGIAILALAGCLAPITVGADAKTFSGHACAENAPVYVDKLSRNSMGIKTTAETGFVSIRCPILRDVMNASAISVEVLIKGKVKCGLLGTTRDGALHYIAYKTADGGSDGATLTWEDAPQAEWGAAHLYCYLYAGANPGEVVQYTWDE